MSDTMSIVVTGANRGIDLALVQHFAKKPPVTPLAIYAGARNPSSIPSIHAAQGVAVHPMALDLSDPNSIKRLSYIVHQKHSNGVDLVFNNAGDNYTCSHTVENGKFAVAVNVDGMVQMTQAFGPIMRRPGLQQLQAFSWIINLSSNACSMRPGPFGSYSSRLRQAFADAKTVNDFVKLREAYVQAIEADRDNEEADGWPKHNSYKIIKSLVNVLTRVTSSDPNIGKGILIECCCPGWVATDMGNMMDSAPKDARARSAFKVWVSVAGLLESKPPAGQIVLLNGSVRSGKKHILFANFFALRASMNA